MTPKEWTEASAQLICLKCGQAIAMSNYTTWAHGEWKDLELRAAWANGHRIHTCAVDLDLAREAMKRYRATHPPMTFEEELELYKSLINPT